MLREDVRRVHILCMVHAVACQTMYVAMCEADRISHVYAGTYHGVPSYMTIHVDISCIDLHTNCGCSAGTSILLECVLAVLANTYCLFSGLLICSDLRCRICECAVSLDCTVGKGLCFGSYVLVVHCRLCGIVCLLSC